MNDCAPEGETEPPPATVTVTLPASAAVPSGEVLVIVSEPVPFGVPVSSSVLVEDCEVLLDEIVVKLPALYPNIE